MAVSFDGETKTITLSVSTSFTAGQVYSEAKRWEDDVGTMQYVSPMRADGKAIIGDGVYTDAIYVLENGWKLKPGGYSAGTQVQVTGTLITDDGSIKTTAPDTGSEVTWLFQVSTFATIVNTAGGGAGDAPTAEENAVAVWSNSKALTASKFLALK